MNQFKTISGQSAGQRANDAFHAESRARVAELAARGEGQVALAEGLALMGIDVKKNERPKLVGFDGFRFRS